MARVAFLSPLPPAPTGIATYARAVLDQLGASDAAHAHEIEPVWPVGPAADAAVWESDVGLYQLGNNVEFHREIYVLAVRHPGVVVLHDLALDDFVAGLIDLRDPLGARSALEARVAAVHLERSDLEVDGPLATPWCALAARRARTVVVHSDFGRRYLEAIGCRTPVVVAPHPVVDAPGGRALRRAEARVARRLTGGGPVVGVLGDVGAAKGIEAVLAGVASLPEPARVAVVGRTIPGFDLEAAVAASGLGDRVIVERDVTDATFEAWVRACDVIVNLRHPHRGEVSGTLIRGMREGKPVVVSAVGTYLDVPDEAVVRVPAGPPDARALAEALGPLVRDPARRRVVGELAGAHVAQIRREDRTARAYVEAIESALDLARDPVRRALSRWAGALTDIGLSGDTGVRYGARYAEALDDLTSSGLPG